MPRRRDVLSVSSTRAPGIRAGVRAPGGLACSCRHPDQRLAGQVGLGDLLLAGQPVAGGSTPTRGSVYSGVTRRPASSMGSRT